eukprot:7401539-Karenia_brevis.AAC.1
MRSAARSASAAYWASWADAIPVLQKRSPRIAAIILQALSTGNQEAASCSHEVQHCRDLLVAQGYSSCPSWQDIGSGVRPEQTEMPEPGEWRHGW